MSKFTMEKATHVLCGKNFEESHVQEARELYEIPVVNEQWVLNSAKLNKLAPTKPYFPITTGKLFNGFIFTMTQVEPQDRLKLYAMITLHGGNVQKDLDNKVTHLLSGGSQSVALKVAGLTKMTIVTPDWVVECLKNRKLIEPDMYHPNLLVSPAKPPSKVTLMTGDMKTPAAIRSQLQQNVRPSRPMVVQMQHTPQQINEIIQSQIQQQQMQEQAKQRAAAAAQAASQSNNQQGNSSLLISQAESGNTTSTTTTSILVQKQAQQPQIQQNLMSSTANNTILLQKQSQQVQQMPTQGPQQSPQVPQSPTQQTMMRMQMQNQTQIQGIVQNQPQAAMTMQPQQMMAQNQQNNIVMQQQTGQPQEKQQFIMKQVQTQPQQTQQFNMAQNQPQQQFIMKQVQSQQPQNQQQQPQTSSGQGYIQIIQQGKQIIQIQHPDGGQMHQKNFMQNQPQIQQQIQLNQAMQQQNPPNVAIQQTTQMPMQQNQPQQVPSSPIQQQQPPRQNIVIINQLQNPQNANQMGMQQQRYFI